MISRGMEVKSVVTLRWPTGSRHEENLKVIRGRLRPITVDTQTFVMNRLRFGFRRCAASVLRAVDEDSPPLGAALVIFISDLPRPRGWCGCPLVASLQFSGFEMDATPQDIQESIEQLVAYRDRLRQDVIAMGQKLKLPQAKIDRTLADHPELTRLEEVLGQLQSQLSQPQG